MAATSVRRKPWRTGRAGSNATTRVTSLHSTTVGARATRRLPRSSFQREIPHPPHRGHFWNSYGPWLLDWQCRAAWLNDELPWIKEIVRSIDATTELCVNPTEVLTNQAVGGTDLHGMARLVDVIGASYHPAWHFTFADRSSFRG